MAFWLHGNTLVANSGIGRDLLEQADCLDAETLETLIRISSLIEKFSNEKRKRDALAAQNS